MPPEIPTSMTRIGSRQSSQTRKKSLFNSVKWGTFSSQFNDYNKKHSKNGRKKSLKTFANYIVRHPTSFHSKTVKRARLYNNIINPSKK